MITPEENPKNLATYQDWDTEELTIPVIREVNPYLSSRYVEEGFVRIYVTAEGHIRMGYHQK